MVLTGAAPDANQTKRSSEAFRLEMSGHGNFSEQKALFRAFCLRSQFIN
jgi:hypothetical protein